MNLEDAIQSIEVYLGSKTNIWSKIFTKCLIMNGLMAVICRRRDICGRWIFQMD